MKLLEDLKPRNIGPAGMSGRITAIDVVTSNPQIIYAGSASGGLWKSESGGINWQPIMDSVNILSIGAVAIDQSNPDVVWAGTGEGNPRNSLTGGYGLYRSLDAGKTWQLMGLEKTRNIHRIIIDKTNSDVVYVGAIGSPWGEHPERGVFKTTDGGKTWNKILYVNEKTGLADLVVDANNPNKLIAAMWEHRRKPWTFNSGGPGSGIYITVDGGATWKKLSDKDGIPKGDLGRVGLAISPSNPKRVYALIEAKKNGFYRSDDGGYTWEKINEDLETIGNRPFYYADIAVDPVNENRIYSVFTYINVSEDGGKSFKQWAASYVLRGIHPDHHAFWVHPNNPNFIIDGNDGGLNITRDRGENWRFAENIPVAQFYHINVDNEIPYNVYGGLQDNGSWAGPGYVFKSGGIRNSYWQEVMFGDGFDVVPDPDEPSRGYGMSQQGFVGHYDLKTGHVEMIRPTHPDPDMRVRFNWNAAIAMDPFDYSTLYFGSQFVHKSTNKGNSWDIISPDLTTNDPEKQKQHESGGLTMDATGAENYTTILAIEPSPLEKNLLWVGTDDGKVHITRDGGKNWSELTANITGLPKGAWIPQIRASKFNAGEAYLVVNNYRNFDFKPYLFRTKDYGQTWQSLLNKPVTFGYTLSLAEDIEEPKLLFLGTEHGLYVSIDEGANWTKWINGYPSVSTMDLAIQQREHDLVMGTFGRAVWVLDDIRPLRELAQKGISILKEPIHTYATPDAYMAANQQATGTRFAGDAIYIGENRNRGAMITYSTFREKKKEKVEKDGEEQSKKKKKNKKATVTEPVAVKKDKAAKNDTIYVSIYNEQNELIRSLTEKYKKNGVHRMYWSMSEKGVKRASRIEPSKNSGEPSGVNVLPGTYKVVMKFDEHKDSTSVKVLFEPRLNVPMSVLKAQYDFFKTAEKDHEVAGKAIAQLQQSSKVIEAILKQLKDRKGDAYDSLKKNSTAVKDSIKILVDELLGAESEKQGIVRDPNPNIMQFYSGVGMYMGSSLQMPGPTEQRLLKQGQEKLAPWLEKVNAFYKDEWPKYQEHVKQTNLSLFKETESFKLN